jgi:peroxiredoxin
VEPEATVPRAAITPAPAPVVGSPAPDFSLGELDGDRVQLLSLRGSPVVIFFWVTGSAPCEAELALLEQRYLPSQGLGLHVLAVDLEEPEAEVRSTASRLGLTFPVLLDPGGDVSDLYRVRGSPFSFFVDREGRIAAEKMGALTDGGELDAMLRSIEVPPT